MTALGATALGATAGLLTAATAGFLWPPLAALLWPAQLRELLTGAAAAAAGSGMGGGLGWLVDVHLQLLFPVSLPVGVLAGYGASVSCPLSG
eukprot:SAG22_NODE_10339_length_540_cov_1.170068_2_plen_91_part_01